MKKIFLLACVLNLSFLNAQPGGGGMRGPQSSSGQSGEQRERPQPKEFNAYKAAGIFNYDANDVVENIKLKKDNELISNVKEAILKYNKHVNELSLLNKDNFDTLNVYMNNIMKSLKSNRGSSNSSQKDMSDNDKDPMRIAKELAKAKVEPVKTKITKAETALNASLGSLLSKKQNEKWLKYQAEFKETQNPTEKTNQNDDDDFSGRGNRPEGGPPQGGGMR
ncbi:hypothetical protein [Mariniflexile sp.]|uniref:hypothetical protein n=1 Tax=Mariniflexile sp. TaxID=1979402 RepID=UPI003566B7B9